MGSGVHADCANFSEYVQKNMKLYELNNDVKMSNNSAANFIRGEVFLNSIDLALPFTHYFLFFYS